VLYEYGSVAKVANARSRWTELREPIVLAAYPIGLLRLYSLQKSIHLTFDGAKSVYVDRRTLATDITLMIKTIADHSKKLVDAKEVFAFFGNWLITSCDPWQICCGHDFLEIFGKSLQTLLGSRRAIDVDLPSIERALRLSYSMEEFRLTNLFRSIRNWEKDNSRICLKSQVVAARA